MTHPLQLVRDQAALDKHTRDLNGLIRQAIIDAIKTRGECHADDLHDLYPVGEVDRCRELATRQFASLRSGKNPLIVERERRASTIPARKRAKSGVYVFTQYGRETVGLSATAQLNRGGPAGGRRSTEPGDPGPIPAGVAGVGQLSDKHDQGRHLSTSSVTDAGSPDSLIQLDEAKPKPRNAIFDDDWEDAA